MDNKYIIIIPTHSNYLDVCKNFIDLLRKNWASCSYKTIVAVSGDNKKLSEVDCIYCGNQATLIDCIKQACAIEYTELYFCFLGDAFISKQICLQNVDLIYDSVKKNDIDYCCLIPKKSYMPVKDIDSNLRKIGFKDRYSHSFIAFLASKRFIENLKSGMSDYEFEMEYLDIYREGRFEYFENHAVVKQDVFHIIPGIDKGKWNRRSLFKLQKHNPDIQFCKRDKLSICEQVKYDFCNVIVKLFSDDCRQIIKSLCMKLNLFEFSSKE